jgi:DNA-binding MarR family transcriptional regulator
MTEIPASAVRAAQEVRVVVGRLRRRLREVAGLDDLTPSQTSVLSRIEKGGPASASELAAAEGVRPQSMAATLAAIGEHGLIKRAPDPADGRRQLISLTEMGREAIRGARQVREEWLARALTDGCTEAERQTIIEALELLDKLAQR